MDSSQLTKFFAGVGSLTKVSAALRSAFGMSELEQFFTTVSRKIILAKEEKLRADKVQATGFNVFDLIDPDENKLSDIIANLLDPEGSHGQRDLFLRLLIKQLGLEPDTEKARVQREAPTYGIMKNRRRIDILIEAGALVAIENKVDSGEQADQVKDYLEHLRHCSHRNSIRHVLIYLTPTARPPESVPPLSRKRLEEEGKLFCWSYQKDLRVWLESCRAGCAAQKISLFLADFLSYIENSLIRNTDNIQEEEDNEE